MNQTIGFFLEFDLIWFDLLIVLVSSANYYPNDSPTTLRQTTTGAMHTNQTIYNQQSTQQTIHANGNTIIPLTEMASIYNYFTTWLPLCTDAGKVQVDENDVQIPNTVASTSAHVQL